MAVLLIKPIAFLTFSLPSPSSLLKLPIIKLTHAHDINSSEKREFELNCMYVSKRTGMSLD